MRNTLIIVCVVAPGLLAWAMGRGLVRLRDDPGKAGGWLKYRTRVTLSMWICAAVLLTAVPGQRAWWAYCIMLLFTSIGGFPARKEIYEETWGIGEFLGQGCRQALAFGGFWALLMASPAIVLAAGEHQAICILVLAVALVTWNGRFCEVFIWLTGASPLLAPDLQLRFNGVLHKVRLPSPRLLRFGSPRGRVARAFAFPASHVPVVLFGETLLTALEPDELTAIFALEVAHLEYYRPRLRRLEVVTGTGIALALLAVPILQWWLPRYAGIAVGIGPLVVVGVWVMQWADRRALEVDCDRRAAVLCGDAEALVRGLTKLSALARLPAPRPNETATTSPQPSLVRRVRALRAASGFSPRPREIPLVAASPTPGAVVVFEEDRVSWLEGVSSPAAREPDALRRAASWVRTLRYSELQELWVERQGNTPARLVARDLRGHRWDLDLDPGDVPAVQSILGGVEYCLAPASPPAEGAWLHGVAQNLIAGVGVVLWRPVARFQVSVEQFLALAMVNLGLLAVGMKVSSGAWGVWIVGEAFGAVSWLSLLLLAGYVLARLEWDRVPPLSFPIIALSAYAVFLALGLITFGLGLPSQTPALRLVLWLAAVVWLALAGVSAVRATLGRWTPRVLVYAGLLVGLVCAIEPYVPLPYWDSASEDAEAENEDAVGPSPAGEETLDRQPKLLETALVSLQPGRPGVTDLYFLGFAGYAAEDVFRNEVETFRTLFDERFDTVGRSMALVNNAKTLDRLPIATTSNLAKALQRIGKVMNSEEDVLFLYLTSHGSASRGLSVYFWPLELHQLPASRIRAMLDEAGIKWRVIVISACYSGTFIERLKGDTTLVATAAAADRTSFGCGRSSDFTYFGQAYFNEALHHTYSFVDAFARAQAAVLKREQAERRQPSLPQISIGPAMQIKLNQLERRLAVRVPS